MKIEIKKPDIQNAGEIIKVNKDTWKTSYRGIVSDDYLDSLNSLDEKRIERCMRQIQDNNPYLIALVNGEIVGMLLYGKSRDDKYKKSGEINAIYVLKEYQGNGIGKKLLLEAVKYLVNENYNSMIIGCLEGSTSNDFYIKMGGKIDYKTECTIGEKNYIENIYYFDNIKLLLIDENMLDDEKNLIQ